MSGLTILIISYGAVSLFYLIYAFVVSIFGEKADSHIRILFPVIHTYVSRKELKILSLVAVTIMTFIVMLGLMKGAVWAMIAAMLLSIWEIVLSFIFYYPRKERANALGHFAIHSAIVAYIVLYVIIIALHL